MGWHCQAGTAPCSRAPPASGAQQSRIEGSSCSCGTQSPASAPRHPSCHQTGAVCCSAAKLSQRPLSLLASRAPFCAKAGTRCHPSCKELMAVKGGHETPGKVLRSLTHLRISRLGHHRSQRTGFGVAAAPASALCSALLCKSCPCCQCGGAPAVLVRRVRCCSGSCAALGLGNPVCSEHGSVPGKLRALRRPESSRRAAGVKRGGKDKIEQKQ